jgi:hypothetical protein
MAEKDCGSCDHQGGFEQKRVECRVDNKWHERGYRCQDFKEYVQGKNTEERVLEAHEIRRRREAGEAEQNRREFEEKMAQKDRDHTEELQRLRMEFDRKLWRASWWWQVLLVVFGWALGVAGTVVFQALRK